VETVVKSPTPPRFFFGSPGIRTADGYSV